MPRKETKLEPLKQLMIKTKACQRLIKESRYYGTEVLQNEQQLEEMRVANRDPYDIKKFQEVLSESYMMIPDSICRRDKAVADLRDFLALLDNEWGINDEVNSSEWMAEAKRIVSESGFDGISSGKEIGGEVIETPLDDLKEGEAF